MSGPPSPCGVYLDQKDNSYVATYRDPITGGSTQKMFPIFQYNSSTEAHDLAFQWREEQFLKARNVARQEMYKTVTVAREPSGDEVRALKKQEKVAMQRKMLQKAKQKAVPVLTISVEVPIDERSHASSPMTPDCTKTLTQGTPTSARSQSVSPKEMRPVVNQDMSAYTTHPDQVMIATHPDVRSPSGSI
jgi:hypothetical protein